MVHLKSRTQCPPNGFSYFQKETGWRGQAWDFNTLCRQVQQHRQANPRLRLNTNMGQIMEDVDVQNAERVAGMANTESYLLFDSSPSPKSFPPQLVQAAQRLAAGVKSLADWLGEGGKPVEASLSESRAAVCVKCPKNLQGDMTSWFTKPASALIRKWIGTRQDLGLKTSHDDRLGVCSSCACPLKLKVHTPINHILDRIPAESKADLDLGCWILSEEQQCQKVAT